MGAEKEKRKTAIYGSAGMAAAGMMPGGKSTAKGKASPPTKPETEPKEIEEAPLEDVAPAAPAFTGKKAVVMGHSGSGDFGHGLDKIFQRLDGVRMMALSDGNGEQLEESKTAAAAPKGFARYEEMLQSETPDLVSLASSWTDERFAMAKASLEAEAHIFSESPFTQTLKEADELLEIAAEKNLKIAVAHPMRCHPLLQQFHQEISSVIGELVELNLFGKMDGTAGGEDLLVQGMHLFDLARWFAGEPSYCTASISKDGNPAIAEDAHEANGLKLGPLLGDTIRANFMMQTGIRVSFLSDRRLLDSVGPWGIDFVGTEGRMRLFAGTTPILSRLISTDPGEPNRTDHWEAWNPADSGEKDGEDAIANRRLVLDWLAAIEENREPASSGASARGALEMIHGVWQAGVTMKRAYFPLVNRLHPLNEESL